MDKYNPLTSGLPSLPFKPGCGSESILSKSKSPLSPDDPVYPAAEPFITWSIVLYQYSHPCPPELIFIVFSSCTCSRINSQASIHSGSSIINSVSSSFKIEPPLLKARSIKLSSSHIGKCPSSTSPLSCNSFEASARFSQVS